MNNEHLRFRSNPWSQSTLAKWLWDRSGIDPIEVGMSMEEIREWHESAQRHSPVVYWINEVALDRVQDVAMFFGDAISDGCAYWNRALVRKTHLAKTGLPLGGEYERSDLIMHAAFQQLVDMIEVDLPKKAILNGEVAVSTTSLFMTKHFGWDRRDPEVGKSIMLASIDAEADQHDQDVIRSLYDLYLWWTVERPNRDYSVDFGDLSSEVVRDRLTQKQDDWSAQDREKLATLVDLSRYLSV